MGVIANTEAQEAAASSRFYETRAFFIAHMRMHAHARACSRFANEPDRDDHKTCEETLVESERFFYTTLGNITYL